ncbi:MAG: NHLP leader peptide family natural product precursor [Acidobacteria bacterium]|nr:MAG: NHLP leader peptide family natural product precursor [Acidobacteriota bacterium]
MAMTRGQLQDLVSKFATDNPKYRDALIKDPKGLLEKQLNASFPDNMQVKAVLETADTAYVVIPHTPGEGELDDADLEKVAGGKMDEYDASCDKAIGAGNTVTVLNL